MDSFRKHKLRLLIAQQYGDSREKFMNKTGVSKSRLAQALSDKYPFGERAARELALRANLPADYFEHLDERTAAFAIKFNELPEHMKKRWEALVKMLGDGDTPA